MPLHSKLLAIISGLEFLNWIGNREGLDNVYSLDNIEKLLPCKKSPTGTSRAFLLYSLKLYLYLSDNQLIRFK